MKCTDFNYTQVVRYIRPSSCSFIYKANLGGLQTHTIHNVPTSQPPGTSPYLFFFALLSPSLGPTSS